MKIILCVKQVPDTTDIKWTEHNTIQREGVESIMNPYDVYALEAALKLKKYVGDTEISTLTMGPSQAVDMLKKTIAVGADKGVLISDRKFAGADTYATGKTIAAAIKEKLSGFDLILCGQFAIDGDTAQTGPSIANHLCIPQVTYVKEIIDADNEFVKVKRELEDGTEIVKVKLPALLCMLQSDFEPTRALINGVIKAQKSDIITYNMDDLGLTPDDVGIKGSPTYVSKAFRPEQKNTQCEICKDCVTLLEKVKNYGVINDGE